MNIKNKQGKSVLSIILIIIVVLVVVFAGLFFITYSGLNSARSKSTEAQIKSNLATIRSEAEIIYDSKKSYSTLCTSSVNLRQVKSETSNKVDCVSALDYYVVSAQLPAGDLYCVDNSGYFGKVNALQAGKACIH